MDSPNKRKVAIYIRVSTAEQKVDGFSPEAQRKKLLDYVNNNPALNLITKPEWIIEDTHTGSDLNRDGFKEIMSLVDKKIVDAVLVWKIDRLSRSLKHLLDTFEKMENKGVSFISIQENIDFKGPIGKLIFQIFGAIAQFERELIRGRTNMGRIASAELGNYTGNYIPYGYKPIKNPSGKGKKLEIIPSEKAQVRLIYDWYIYDDLGADLIAKKLNHLSVPKGKFARENQKHTPWSGKNIYTILQSTIYRGEFVANTKDEFGNDLKEDEWTVVSIPACVSEFTFELANRVRKNKNGGKANYNYLLRGKIYDMDLEKPRAFTGKPRTKGGYSYIRKSFKDSTGKTVPICEITAEQIEELIWGKIVQALENPELFIQNYVARRFNDPTRRERLERDLNNLRERNVQLELNIARIEKAYDEGSYSLAKMELKVNQANKELMQVRAKTSEIEDEIAILSTSEIEIKKLRDASEKVKYNLANLDRKGKQVLCDLFVERIGIHKKQSGTTEGGRKLWDITADIYFRFNPYKLSAPDTMGGTTQATIHNKKGTSADGNSFNGGWEQT